MAATKDSEAERARADFQSVQAGACGPQAEPLGGDLLPSHTPSLHSSLGAQGASCLCDSFWGEGGQSQSLQLPLSGPC